MAKADKVTVCRILGCEFVIATIVVFKQTIAFGD
jgi:hypothetical protein